MIEHHSVRTNGVTLHVASCGPIDGPLLIFLHGFPEGWFAWRHYLPVFADAGFRVLAPDQRGYGDSDKPPKVSDYELDVLAEDVVGLIDGAAKKSAFVVGHDWGAAVVWWTAMLHPERVEGLAVLNAPHPIVMRDALLKNPSQLRRSWYMLFFQVPWLPERLIKSRGGRAFLERIRSIGRPDAFDEEDDRYLLESWKKPGAVPSMINWYRASIRQATNPPAIDPRIQPKTLILWGRNDELLGSELVEPSAAACDDVRVHWFDNATHWVNHEERGGVTSELLRFLASERA